MVILLGRSLVVILHQGNREYFVFLSLNEGIVGGTVIFYLSQEITWVQNGKDFNCKTQEERNSPYNFRWYLHTRIMMPKNAMLD